MLQLPPAQAALGLTGVTLLPCHVAVLLSNLMGNTTASNLLVPLGLGLATGSEPRLAQPLAMSASARMCSPIATPPYALVFAGGA